MLSRNRIGIAYARLAGGSDGNHQRHRISGRRRPVSSMPITRGTRSVVGRSLWPGGGETDETILLDVVCDRVDVVGLLQ